MPISVEIDGFGKVAVHSCLGTGSKFDPFPDFVCIPPDTAHTEPVASIDRGENMHGSLLQNFYLCINNFYDDAEYFVLWLGEGGSQLDDSQARLLPVAYAEMSSFFVDDYGYQDGLAAAALLYGWVSMRGDDYEDEDVCSGHLISDDQVELIHKDACAGNPFKFIDALKTTA